MLMCHWAMLLATTAAIPRVCLGNRSPAFARCSSRPGVIDSLPLFQSLRNSIAQWVSEATMKGATTTGTRTCGSKLKATLARMTAVCNTTSHVWLVRSSGLDIGFIITRYPTSRPSVPPVRVSPASRCWEAVGRKRLVLAGQRPPADRLLMVAWTDSRRGLPNAAESGRPALAGIDRALGAAGRKARSTGGSARRATALPGAVECLHLVCNELLPEWNGFDSERQGLVLESNQPHPRCNEFEVRCNEFNSKCISLACKSNSLHSDRNPFNVRSNECLHDGH